MKVMALGFARRLAVHVLLEELENLGPALLLPRLGVLDRRAVGADERVGQRVLADLRLIVVGFLAERRGCGQTRQDDCECELDAQPDG